MTDRSEEAGAGGTGGAMVLCMVGAALILLQGVYDLALGSLLESPLFGVLSVPAQAIGAFGVFTAIVLEVLALALYFEPHRHLALGVGIMTVALLSLFAGGGLLLGTFLCYAGSLIAIFASVPAKPRAKEVSLPPEAMDDPVLEADLRDSGGSATPNRSRSRSP